MVYRIPVIFIILISVLFIKQSDAQQAVVDSSGHSGIADLKNSNEISLYLKSGKKYEHSNPDSAWFYYKKARLLATHSNDRRNLSHYISHAIILLNNEGKYDKALQLGHTMVGIGLALIDTTILIKGYNNIASDNEYMGAFQEASQNYLTALDLANRINNRRMQQRLNNNMASVFIELKDYISAHKYAETSLQMAEMNRDTAAMGSSLINLGRTELHKNKSSRALNYFDRTIIIGKKLNNAALTGDAKINKGHVYTRLKDFRKARIEFEQVQDMAQKSNMPYYGLNALFSLAVLEQQNHNYIRASNLAKRAITIGERLGASEELREMYDTLSVILEKTGDLKGALLYRQKFEKLNDSMMSARVKTNINRLQIEYRTAQKDEQIAEQNIRLQKNHATIMWKNILLLISGSGILVLLALIILGYRYYRQRQKLQEQTILNFGKEQEVNQIKAIMQGKDEERRRISTEMHDDIGSALTTIMYLCNNLNGNENDNKQTVSKIASTAGTVITKMNEIIWSMNKDYDTLEDLLTYIRFHSVDLLENNGLKYQFSIPDQIPTVRIEGEKRRNMYLVIKEALHNIIKHAEATMVQLSFRIDKNLIILICDNGKGIQLDNLRNFGNGLKNMQSRMENIGGTFSITRHEGTKICISLPLSEQTRVV